MAGQQDYLPSFHQGCARSPAESELPDLWCGLAGAWIPGLGATGGRVFDVSGSQSNGVWQGSGTTHWAASLSGPTMVFNGTDDCVNLGNPAALHFGLSDFSIMVFFQTGFGAGNLRYLFSKSLPASAVGRFAIGFDTGVLQAFGTDDGSYAVAATVSESAYRDGQWHSVVGVWNRKRGLELWTDGQLKSTNVALASYPSVSYTTSYVAGIGAYDDASGTTLNECFWQGAIGPVYAYRRALDARTIQRLNADPLAPFRLRRPVYAASAVAARKLWYKSRANLVGAC